MATTIDNVLVTIIFGAPPLRAASFSTGLLIRDGVSLNGARSKEYTSESALKADLDASYIDAYTYNTGLKVLSQSPSPGRFRVLRVKTTAPENEAYDTILSAFLATPEGKATFAYFLDVDTVGIVTACSAIIAAQTQRKLLGITTDDLAAATTYAALANTRGLVIDYDLDSLATYNKGMVGVMSRLAFDQDRRTPGFTGPVTAIVQSNAALTDAQRDTLVAGNVNLYAPRAPFAVYRYPGLMFDGTPTTAYVSAAWLQARVDEAVSTMLGSYDAAGLILPLDEDGQELVAGVVEGVLELGVQLRKVQPGQYVVTKPTITPTNLADGEMPLEAAVQLSTPTIRIVIPITVSQLPVTITTEV